MRIEYAQKLVRGFRRTARMFLLFAILVQLIAGAIAHFSFGLSGRPVPITLAVVVMAGFYFVQIVLTRRRLRRDSCPADLSSQGERIAALLSSLCERLCVSKPRLRLWNSARSSNTATCFDWLTRADEIVVDPDVFVELDDEEAQAILAHELGHSNQLTNALEVFCSCLQLGVLTVFLVGSIVYFWTQLCSSWWSPFWTIPIIAAVCVAGLLASLAWNLFHSLGCQYRELCADAFSAVALGSPTSLVRALNKLLKRNGDPQPRGFRSHPSLAVRIKLLENLDGG